MKLTGGGGTDDYLQWKRARTAPKVAPRAVIDDETRRLQVALSANFYLEAYISPEDLAACRARNIKILRL